MGFMGWGLLLSYNPFFIYYLMKNGAVGGTRIRIVLVFSLGLATLLLHVFQLSKNSLRFKVGFTSLCMLSLFFGTLLACFWAFVRANDVVYFMIDLLPLVEFFIAYFVIKLSIDSKGGLVITHRTFQVACWFISLMVLTDLGSYFFLTYVEGANFGALKAYIDGRIVNRLPDFILPSIAPFLVYRLIQYSTGLFEKLLTLMVLAVTFLSFYRTIYASFAFTTFALFSLHIFGIKRKHALRILISAMILLFVIGIVIMNSSDGYHEYLQLFAHRFQSIFTLDSALENSKSSRLSQFSYFAYTFSYFPVGWGLGAVINSDPVAVMFNYFMQIGLLLGLPFLSIFLLLWTTTILRVVRGIYSATSPLEDMFYKAMFSITLSLGLILNIFPYMTYFPFLFAFGAILAMLESPIVFVNTRISPESDDILGQLTPALSLPSVEPQER